jgi:hypothetical protein
MSMQNTVSTFPGASHASVLGECELDLAIQQEEQLFQDMQMSQPDDFAASPSRGNNCFLSCFLHVPFDYFCPF